MKRLTYLQNVYAAYEANHTNLGVVAGISPHVDPERVLAALENGNTVAIPAAYVSGAYYAVKKLLSGGLHIKPVRPQASFLHPELRLAGLPDRPMRELFATEAIAYARDKWGDELFVDTGMVALAYVLRDRTRLQPVHNDDAAFVAQVCAVLGVNLFSRDEDPLSLDAIAGSALYVSHAPLSVIEAEELGIIGSARYCVHCGHWLAMRECPGCNPGHFMGNVRVDRAQHVIFPWPMPQGVIDAFRERGHLQGVNAERWLQQPAAS